MCKIREMNLETAKYYGYEAQSNQLVEECAELIQAVNKYRRVETGLGQPVAEDKKAIARDNLKVEFSRNVPNNLTEIVDTVTKLDGNVDKETLLSLLPFIDNPKEVLEKLEADKERDRQSTDPYSMQNVTEDSNNLFPNLNAQNSPQEALNAQGATIPQSEQ